MVVFCLLLLAGRKEIIMTKRQISQVASAVIEIDGMRHKKHDCVGIEDFVRGKIREVSGSKGDVAVEGEDDILRQVLHQLWAIQEDARLASLGVKI